MIKIVYAAGNRPGANIQLSRFLKVAVDFDIKIAAYFCDLPIVDWSLDIFTEKTLDHSKQITNSIKNDIIKFSPDLIITDGEEIIPYITRGLNIPLWSCSSLHLLDGCIWDYRQIKLRGYGYNIKLPNAYKLIYSPFCDIFMRPILKPGYEWIRPYTEPIKTFYKSTNQNNKMIEYIKDIKPDNNFYCTGETSFVSDAFYAEKNICIESSSNDPESLLNGFLCQWFNIGYNAGNLEKTNINYIKEQIDIFLNKTYKQNYISKQNIPTLDEKINEVFSS